MTHLTLLSFDRAHPDLSPVAASLSTLIEDAVGQPTGRRTAAERRAKVRAQATRQRAKSPATVFKPGKTYSMSAAGNVEFMGVPPTILSHLFRDGRISGLLMEHALAAQFRNISVVSDKSAPYDLFITDAAPGAQRFECKVMTGKKGADISPSAMKGSKRAFNRKAFVKRMRNIDGVIVIDITQFPKITLRSFSTADLYTLGYPRYLTVEQSVPTHKGRKTSR